MPADSVDRMVEAAAAGAYYSLDHQGGVAPGTGLAAEGLVSAWMGQAAGVDQASVSDLLGAFQLNNVMTLAEPRWVRIDNGNCVLDQGRIMNYLGAFQFFYSGHFLDPGDGLVLLIQTGNMGWRTITKYQFGPATTDCMINCVTERVLLCVVITLFLYWVTVVVMSLQDEAMPESAETAPQVSFDVSFYLITAAGVMSVIAVACSCLRRYPFLENEAQPSARAIAILDEQFNFV
nr:hypothetical protein BaRGS_011280 [Batillaria attramentaria]